MISTLPTAEVRMTYYIYRLPAGALAARGLDGLIEDDNPHLLAYFERFPVSQCLYIEVGTGHPKHTSKEELYWLRQCYSTMMCLNPGAVRRLLTVRNDWSRK